MRPKTIYGDEEFRFVQCVRWEHVHRVEAEYSRTALVDRQEIVFAEYLKKYDSIINKNQGYFTQGADQTRVPEIPISRGR